MIEPVTAKRAPGGWLMVEVAVGGVMAGVILAGLLITVGAAMDRTTVASRSLTASSLAQQGIEQARLLSIAGTLDAGTTTVSVPTGLTGTYTRSRVVTTGSTVVGAHTVTYRDVTVAVSFPVSGTAKTITLQTRIYQP